MAKRVDKKMERIRLKLSNKIDTKLLKSIWSLVKLLSTFILKSDYLMSPIIVQCTKMNMSIISSGVSYKLSIEFNI